jgi:hypothetical protein
MRSSFAPSRHWAVLVLLVLGTLPLLAQDGGISLNSEISVVPAPGAVVIDGKTDDWDLSAGVWSYNDPTLVAKYSLWTHLMADDKGVYFLARYYDKSPLQNSTQGKDFSKSWRADAFQARVIFDDRTPDEHQMHINLFYSTPEKRPYMIVKHGGFRAQPPYDDTGVDRPDLAQRFGSDMEPHGGKVAFRTWDDGKGYNVEAFWPWKYCRLSGKALAPGESFTFGIEAMWGNGDGTLLVHRLADGIKNDRVNRIFMFRARSGWGRATLAATGNLGITQAQETLQAQRLKLFIDLDTYGSIPITYTLPDDREVTLAIDNSQGVRVRNLIGQYPRKAGAVTDRWDGLDDAGKPVPPGKYTVTLVDHKPVAVKLLNSVYNASTPPWTTDTGGASWGSNHGHPTTIATRGDVIIAGFTGTEGTSGILRCGPDGRMQWADKNEILDAAIGTAFVYTLSRDSWIRQTVVRRLDLATGQITTFADAVKSPLIALPTENGQVSNASSIALSGGKLHALVIGGKTGTLFRLDPASGAIEASTELAGELAGLIALTDRDETLYGLLADGTVCRLSAAGTLIERLFIAKGVAAPKRLGIAYDATRFAISDGGTNQVFVFDARGKRVQTLGTAYQAVNGMRPAGKFIQTDFIDPLGLDFDAAGRLWVTEAESSCKRVTIWTPKGKLVRAFWGAADYGAMSAFPITFDSSRFIAHGIEFALDPAPDVLQRATNETPLVFHPELAHERGLIVRYQGREFASTVAGFSKPKGYLIARRDKSGAFRPCVQVTFGPKGTDGTAWIDRNGDFAQDPDEKTIGVAGRPHYWIGGWMRPDLTIITADQTVYPLTGLTKEGVPVYDFTTPIRPANKIEARLHEQGSTGTACMDLAGNISDGIRFATADGRKGSYPNRYGRHDAPAAQRGVLIAPFRTNGIVEGVPGVGSVVALGGDRGEWFLLSMDGLYLTSILQDSKGDVTLDETFTGQESFGGNFWRDETPGKGGRLLAQLGGQSYRIVEITGLETTRKQTLTVEITQAQIDEGLRIATGRAKSLATEPGSLKIARVAKLPTEPAAVGLAADQPLLPGAPDVRVQMAGDATRWFRAALAHDGTTLALLYTVADASPWKNGEGRFTHLFIGGDAVDLKVDIPGRGPIRLLAAPLNGVNTAAYWQRTATVKNNPQTYVVGNNVGNASSFDVVRPMASATILHKTGDTGYSVLVTVPLADLGITPATMRELKGTLGVIFSDPSGKNRLARLYWYDKQTDLVSDVPSESRLAVERFGRIEVEK